MVCPHKAGAQRIESTKAVEQPPVKRQLHDNQRLATAKQALSHYVDHKDVKNLLATISEVLVLQRSSTRTTGRPKQTCSNARVRISAAIGLLYCGIYLTHTACRRPGEILELGSNSVEPTVREKGSLLVVRKLILSRSGLLLRCS